jgi:hypothetical protein
MLCRSALQLVIMACCTASLPALLPLSNDALPCLVPAGTISRRERRGAAPNRDYLSSSIRYEDGKLIDEQGEHAMHHAQDAAAPAC